MSSCWKDSLPQKLERAARNNPLEPVRICIVGVGNELRGDDSAGLLAARLLLADERLKNAPHLLVLEGGPAPENLTGRIRRFQPDLVLFIDAADLGEAPGTICWIPLDAIEGMSASSHSLPLSMLAQFIHLEIGCDVAVLGIQPLQNEIASELSSPVRAAIDELTSGLRASEFFASAISLPENTISRREK